MGEVVCVDDVKQIAKTKISELQWAYLSGAAEHEYTKRDNENAFRRYEYLVWGPRRLTANQLTTTSP